MSVRAASRSFFYIWLCCCVSATTAFGQSPPLPFKSPAATVAAARYGQAMAAARQLYLKDLDVALKQSMQRGQIDEANALSAARKLVAEGVDPDAKVASPAAQSAIARYRQNIIPAKQQYVRDMDVAMKAAMARSDLTEANAINDEKKRTVEELTSLVTLQTAALTARPAAVSSSSNLIPAVSGRGIALLAEQNKRLWNILLGDWKFENNTLIGSGYSDIQYVQSISVPFTLQFRINVLAGKRPRVHFGKMTFANATSRNTFALYPGADNTKLFVYETGREYRITITATRRKAELFIDGNLASSVPSKLGDKIDYLQFSAGDSWSKGNVRYSDIELIHGLLKP